MREYVESSLTVKQILEEFTYIGKTPALGLHYFSEELGICAVVYKDYAKVFTHRSTEGMYAMCFEKVNIIERKENIREN